MLFTFKEEPSGILSNLYSFPSMLTSQPQQQAHLSGFMPVMVPVDFIDELLEVVAVDVLLALLPQEVINKVAARSVRNIFLIW